MHGLRSMSLSGCAGPATSRPLRGNAHSAPCRAWRKHGRQSQSVWASATDDRAAGATSSAMSATPAWDREHEYLTTDNREEQLTLSAPNSNSGDDAVIQRPAWASGHMEELRCQIQAMWVASGDVDWLSMIMRDRAEERSRTVRAQLAPLLPEGGTFALGELLFYDRATMLEKVTLVLGYEYGVDPQYLQPYTPLGHLMLGHGPASSSSPLPAASSAWSVFDVERLTETVRAALGVAPELPGVATGASAGELAADEERAEAMAAAVAEMSLRALAEAVYQALEPERSFWTYG